MRKLIFITGLMGAGKSTVSDILRLRGHEVLNMDNIAKATIANEMYGDFYKAFNTGYDRENAKEVYFSPEYKAEREKFETKLDNYLSERILYLLSKHNPECNDPLFVEVPAMRYSRFDNFIDPLDKHVKCAILVSTIPEIRCNRLIKNRNLNCEQIVARTELQSEDIPVAIVHTVYNNGSLSDLTEQIEKLGF